MDESGYRIEIDRDTNLMRFDVVGFWDATLLQAFLADRRAAFATMRCGLNRHATIVDVSRAPLQNQALFDQFRGLMIQTDTRSVAMAFVGASTLSAMQIRRMTAGRSDIATFDTARQAVDWLQQIGAMRNGIPQPAGRWLGGTLAHRRDAA